MEETDLINKCSDLINKCSATQSANISTIITNLTVWLMLTVLISVIPIGVDYVVKTIKTGQTPQPNDFLTDGQLLLIAVALGAEALGGVLFTGKEYSFVEVLAISFCVLSLVCSALLYPFITNMKQNQQLQDPS